MRDPSAAQFVDPAWVTNARNIELDRTLDAIARELPPLTIHQRIVLAREIEAYGDRLPRFVEDW
jgi:hypothetical protein